VNPVASESCFRFTHALVRVPGRGVSLGLRAGGGPDPDAAELRNQHRAYVDALTRAGVEVTELAPLEQFPDSVFVEDAALCLGGCAVVLRPGAPSRSGESAALRPDLVAVGLRIVELPATARIDGGDVLVTDTDVFVGCSARTDDAGIAALVEAVEPLGYNVTTVRTPDSILHFKTDCGLLDSTTIFATERLAATGCFDGYDVVLAPSGEEAAANLLRVNDVVFLADGWLSGRAGVGQRSSEDRRRSVVYVVAVQPVEHWPSVLVR